MDRLHLAAAFLAALATNACGPSFKERKTPSGDFCSDMPIVPAGQDVDREYHRLQPIQSDPTAHTEAQRLESLRKAGCTAGADAVIEAVNEEVRGENAQYVTVSSGTAVTWIRHANAELKPLTISTKKAPAPEPTAAPTADPAPTPEPTASAAPSAKASAGKPSKPAPKTAPKP